MKLRRIEGDLWEIPREGGMRVPGRVYSVGPPVARRPRAPAGRERRAPPRHPPLLARDARHPLGVRLPHRRRRGGRRGARRHLARRRRLRHQLRRAGAHDARSRRTTLRAALHAVGRAALPRHPDRRRREPGDPARSPGAELDEVLARGRALGGRGAASRRRTDDAERCEEGGRLAGADPATVSERARLRGADQLGTLGSGQPLPRARPRRGGLRRRPRPRRSGSCPGQRRRADPLRLARARLPGLRRVPRARSRARRGDVRRRSTATPRPAARLRADRERRRAGATSARCRRPRTSPGRTGR